MKKLLSLFLSTVLAINVVGCAKVPQKSESEPTQEQVQIPNPIVTYETIDEAQEALDFEPVLPEKINEDYKISHICVIDKKLFQVTFKNGTDEVLYRMSKGSEDISGDYNEYELTRDIDVDGIKAVFKGNADKVYVMTWSNDDFSYSISFTAGISEENAKELIK